MGDRLIPKVAFAIVLGVAMFPPTAGAATAFVEIRDGDRYLIYTAAPGEKNDVETTVAGGVITVRDSGAVIVAGNECESLNAHEVQCPTPWLSFVGLDDLDDVATIVGRANVSAGPGNDTVTGTGDVRVSGADGNDIIASDGWMLSGDGGNDTITGGDDSNLIEGGPGNDMIDGGGAYDAIWPGLGDDSVDGGGAETDSVIFDDVSAPVVVDLATGRAVGHGEDTLVSVERVFGSDQADRLLGNAETNSLKGGGGADVLLGRGGNDFLDGGFGADVIRGGGGNDWLRGSQGQDRHYGQWGRDRTQARDQEPDLVRGGPGLDRAWSDRRLDDLAGIEERCPEDC